MTTLSYLYQLQNVTYNELANNFARVNVIDPDDALLTTSQLYALESGGRTMFSYLSIGEAEDYRDYWENGNWDTNLPSFVLAENPDWPGNFPVAFWDPNWQAIMLSKIISLATQGFNGAYLDIVDGYENPTVIAAYDAYSGPGKTGNIRADMESFVIHLSESAKAINPAFKIIPQNALDLLTLPGSETVPNTRYLAAIDGVGKEDTFYNDNAAGDDTAHELKLLDLAIDNGKFVLAIDYPTNAAKQEDFITKALQHGFIPFVGDRELDDLGATANTTIPGRISDDVFDLLSANVIFSPEAGATLFGTVGNDIIYGLNDGRHVQHIYAAAGDDTIYASGGHNLITADEGNDVVIGGSGDDSIFGWTGDDTLYGGAGLGKNFLAGDEGNDSVIGGSEADTIYGWTGNDTLSGNEGNDYLFGDAGADSLTGGDGNDTMYGWTGNDTIFGGNGNDLIFGDDGNDIVIGDAGNDSVYGWMGNDNLDLGEGNNLGSGEQGNDSLLGGAGQDSLYGGDGSDWLRTGSGNDYLEGGAGGDVLVGGTGVDFIYGGADGDIFVFAKGDSTFSATDTIVDFEDGSDRIDIQGLTSLADGAGTTLGVQYTSAGDTIIFNTESNFAVLLVGHHSFTSSDFSFS